MFQSCGGSNKIVTSQAKNTDCFSHCYLLTKADSYHTGHLRITYGNPRQLPEKGAKNVYLGIQIIGQHHQLRWKTRETFYFNTRQCLRQITIIFGCKCKKKSSSHSQSRQFSRQNGRWSMRKPTQTQGRTANLQWNPKIMQIFSLSDHSSHAGFAENNK